MKLEILKKIIGVLLIIVTMNISVFALAWSSVVFSFVSAIVNMWPIPKLINYSISEQIKDILPIIICCIISGGFSWGLSLFVTTHVILLISQTLIFATSYYFLSLVFCKEQIGDLTVIVKKFIKK